MGNSLFACMIYLACKHILSNSTLTAFIKVFESSKYYTVLFGVA